MCQTYTGRWGRRMLLASLLAGGVALGQTATEALRPAWRKVGSSSVELMLAAPATGAVDSVWFAPDGRTLYARTHSGKTFETADFVNWTPSTALRPDPARAVTVRRIPV